MSTIFETRTRGLDSPATDAIMITPHDTQDLAMPVRALQVWGAGQITFITYDGTLLSFAHPGGGAPVMVAVRRIMATGTDATDIMGLL